MTRAAWAERAINKLPMALGSDSVDAKAAIKLVEAEHKRAVRVVKQEIVATEKLRDTALRVDSVAAEAVYLDTIVALNKALAALQKGRT